MRSLKVSSRYYKENSYIVIKISYSLGLGTLLRQLFLGCHFGGELPSYLSVPLFEVALLLAFLIEAVSKKPFVILNLDCLLNLL